MQPWVAGGGILLLCCVTTTCYFFRIPDALTYRPPSEEAHRYYWGAPDSEFNWCESDYKELQVVAEPMNTFSNVFFVALPLMFLGTHDAGKEVTSLAMLQVLIGVGSMLFHASLRYNMQLADELPIFYFGLASLAAIVRRIWGPELHIMLFAVAGSLTALILLTTQKSLLHEVGRGCMTMSFAGCLVMMAYGLTRVVQLVGVKTFLSEKLRWAHTFADRVLTFGYISLVVSVFCWLGDNYFCDDLKNLPAGLPYPHLHLWWHVFSSLAIFSSLLLLQLHDALVMDRLVGIRRIGLLPVVVQSAIELERQAVGAAAFSMLHVD